MIVQTRRDFLSTCGILAASLAYRCSFSGTMTKTAAEFIVNPSIDDYAPALDALIDTVLPTGPAFPLDRATVERRLLRMFPLELERKFLGFQKTLVYFDSLDLAPHVAPPLMQSERIAMDVPVRLSETEFDRIAKEKTDAAAKKCDAFFAQYGKAERFREADASARLAWLRLWSESEFAVKRDFAHGVRAMIFVSTYSSDRAWKAIGYDGPLVGGSERVS